MTDTARLNTGTYWLRAWFMGFRGQTSPFHTVPYIAMWLDAAPREMTFSLTKSKIVLLTQCPRLWVRVEESQGLMVVASTPQQGHT